MITFLIGLALLIVGAVIYGTVCEKVMKPTDRKTPAVEKFDGVDYVPMKKWKNSLIELLNIAGTGPILGPIQGILFGPIAFITIPLGCVIGGAFHDYISGMISVRNGGEQMPSLVKRFLGKYVYVIYNIFVCLLMLLVGVVFIYTPGDLFVTQILGSESTLENPVVWIVYGVIFAYYIIATLLPIDKIIGKIYPVFGAILLLSAVGVFVGLFINGYSLDEIWETGLNFVNPYGDKVPHFDPDAVFNFHLEDTKDCRVLLDTLGDKLERGEPGEASVEVSSTDRAFGTLFGSEITRKNPAASKRITIPQAILLVLGSALLVLLMILFLKDIGQKTWYFWAPI